MDEKGDYGVNSQEYNSAKKVKCGGEETLENAENCCASSADVSSVPALSVTGVNPYFQTENSDTIKERVDDYYESISDGDDIDIDLGEEENMRHGDRENENEACVGNNPSFVDLPFVPKLEFSSELRDTVAESKFSDNIYHYEPHSQPPNPVLNDKSSDSVDKDLDLPPPSILNPLNPGLTIAQSSGANISSPVFPSYSESVPTVNPEASSNLPSSTNVDWLDENGDPVKGAFDYVPEPQADPFVSAENDSKVEYVFSVKPVQKVDLGVLGAGGNVDSLRDVSENVFINNEVENAGLPLETKLPPVLSQAEQDAYDEEKKLYEASKSKEDYLAAVRERAAAAAAAIEARKNNEDKIGAKKERYSRFKRNRFTNSHDTKDEAGTSKEEPLKSKEDQALESQAVTEILKEVKHGAERAKVYGALGWQKRPMPVTNKTFLRNTLVSTLREPYRPPGQRGQFHVGLRKDKKDDDSSSRSSSSSSRSSRSSYSRSRSGSRSRSRSRSRGGRPSGSRGGRGFYRGGHQGHWSQGQMYYDAWGAPAMEAYAAQYGYPWYDPEAYAMYYEGEWPMDAYGAMYYGDPQAWAEYAAYYGQNFHPRGRGRGHRGGRGGWRFRGSRSPRSRSASRDYSRSCSGSQSERSRSRSRYRDRESRSGSRSFQRRRSQSRSRSRSGRSRSRSAEGKGSKRSRSYHSHGSRSMSQTKEEEGEKKKKKTKKKKKKHGKSKKSKHKHRDKAEKEKSSDNKKDDNGDTKNSGNEKDEKRWAQSEERDDRTEKSPEKNNKSSKKRKRKKDERQKRDGRSKERSKDRADRKNRDSSRSSSRRKGSEEKSISKTTEKEKDKGDTMQQQSSEKEKNSSSAVVECKTKEDSAIEEKTLTSQTSKEHSGETDKITSVGEKGKVKKKVKKVIKKKVVKKKSGEQNAESKSGSGKKILKKGKKTSAKRNDGEGQKSKGKATKKIIKKKKKVISPETKVDTADGEKKSATLDKSRILEGADLSRPNDEGDLETKAVEGMNANTDKTVESHNKTTEVEDGQGKISENVDCNTANDSDHSKNIVNRLKNESDMEKGKVGKKRKKKTDSQSAVKKKLKTSETKDTNETNQ